jgi:hypothetical protein
LSPLNVKQPNLTLKLEIERRRPLRSLILPTSIRAESKYEFPKQQAGHD